jgi:hypothetical protein
MKGWKTWAGSALIAVGTILTTIPPIFEAQHELGKVLIGIGASLTAVGIGHKVEKSSK